MAAPYYLAWVGVDDNTFIADYVREDEDVFSFEISQEEGDFASLEVEVVNPRIGLLAPGRNQWAWFSCADGESSEGVRPLFFGRLVGMPEDIADNVVKLTFIARPLDYNEQKAALAETMKVRPYWDSIWFAHDNIDEPDNVLESRSALWHVDRVTHEVATSDILTGEEGTLTFSESEVFADSIRVNYGTPLRRVDVAATVSWDQEATGVYNATPLCVHGAPFSIKTFTGDGLIDSWPKSGASLGGGWKVETAGIKRLDSRGAPTWFWAGGSAPPHKNYTIPYSYKVRKDFITLVVPPWAAEGNQEFNGWFSSEHLFGIPMQELYGSLELRYEAKRGKTETLAFSVEADVQAIYTDPEGDDVLALSFSSSEVTQPIDPGGAIPIGYVGRATYLAQARGTQSIEYLVAVARARLLAGARCVNVTFETPIELALMREVNCRKSAVLIDHQLPGGQAAGKIKSYRLSGNGEGEFTCEVTLGCSVGKGGTVTALPGTPTYAAEGYMAEGYQRYESEYVMPFPSDIAFENVEGAKANDDGIDFERFTSPVLSMTKTNTYDEQRAHVEAQYLAIAKPTDTTMTPSDILNLLKGHECAFDLRMVPVTGGPFQTDFAITTSGLKIPKTIDLEAESSS